MKTNELREKSEKELKRLLVFEREKLRDLRFKVSQRQLKNLRAVRSIKRNVARLLTMLKEKKGEANSE